MNLWMHYCQQITPWRLPAKLAWRNWPTRRLERPGVVRLTLSEPSDLRWDIAFILRQGAYLSRAAQAWLQLLREQPQPD